MTETRTAPKTAAERCDRLVKLLSERTGIAWSFGYLGDCSGMPGTPAFRDSRSWFAFAAHPGRVGTTRDSIGGTSSPDEMIPVLVAALQLATVLAEPR